MNLNMNLTWHIYVRALLEYAARTCVTSKRCYSLNNYFRAVTLVRLQWICMLSKAFFCYIFTSIFLVDDSELTQWSSKSNNVKSTFCALNSAGDTYPRGPFMGLGVSSPHACSCTPSVWLFYIHVIYSQGARMDFDAQYTLSGSENKM